MTILLTDASPEDDRRQREAELERIRNKLIKDLTPEEFDKLPPNEQRWIISDWSKAQEAKR